MKNLKEPRAVPRRPDGQANPLYFEIELEGLPAQWFRLPNDRIVVELIETLSRFSVLDDGLSFGGSVDALAAIVGASWWDPTRILETEKPRRGGDWLAYGEQVLEEFHEEGISGTVHLAPWAAELAKRFGSILTSPESTINFGEAQKASEISSDLISA
jgi:hypothetical protein